MRPVIPLWRLSPWLPVLALPCLAMGCAMGREVPAAEEPYQGGYQQPPPMPQPTPDPRPEASEWENARMQAEGKGEDFRFKAKRDGMVWVVNSRDRKLLYRTKLAAGEEITVSPFRDVIEIDGKRVRKVDMDNRYLIRIFFFEGDQRTP